MKIRSVVANNRKKAFAVTISGKRTLSYPYAMLDRPPAREDPIEEVFVDPELAREAFTYRLRSGHEASIHVEQVLDYNRDPDYLRDLTIYELTVEASERVERSDLSKREIIRRLGTSATQFYRLLGGRGESPMGLVTPKRGQMQGAATRAMPLLIVEERERSRWPLFGVTLWARGGCGR